MPKLLTYAQPAVPVVLLSASAGSTASQMMFPEIIIGFLPDEPVPLCVDDEFSSVKRDYRFLRDGLAFKYFGVWTNEKRRLDLTDSEGRVYYQCTADYSAGV